MDHQLFFPQAYGTDVNYCPFLDLSADNLSDQGHISGIRDKRYSFRLMGWDVYWKEDLGLRVLPWLPSNFYLIPSPFVGSSGGEACRGFQNFHNRRRTYWALLFSSLWVTHLAGMGLYFIVIAPFLLSRCGCFFFIFGRGHLFLVDSSVLLSMTVQQPVTILVFLQEEMSACPSIPPLKGVLKAENK